MILSVNHARLLKVGEVVPGGEGVWIGVAEGAAAIGEDGLELAAGLLQLPLVMQNPGKVVPGDEGVSMGVAATATTVGKEGLELAAGLAVQA
jgi:hypothetical protein